RRSRTGQTPPRASRPSADEAQRSNPRNSLSRCSFRCDRGPFLRLSRGFVRRLYLRHRTARRLDAVHPFGLPISIAQLPLGLSKGVRCGYIVLVRRGREGSPAMRRGVSATSSPPRTRTSPESASDSSFFV